MATTTPFVDVATSSVDQRCRRSNLEAITVLLCPVLCAIASSAWPDSSDPYFAQHKTGNPEVDADQMPRALFTRMCGFRLSEALVLDERMEH